MNILLFVVVAYCLVGLYLIVFSRLFRTTVWGPMPPLATMRMFLLSKAFRNEFDPDRAKPIPEWRGYLLGYPLLVITGLAAMVCWPFVLLMNRREAKAITLRLSDYDRERQAEITAAYTAPLPADQDAKTFGELWKRHNVQELPKFIVVVIHTWDVAHLEGIRGNFCKFILEGNTYVCRNRRGDIRASLPTEEIRRLIESVRGYPLMRKRPAHLDHSFDFSGEVTEIKIVFSIDGDEPDQFAGPTIEIEHKHGETTCVYYIGSHTNSDNLRRENPCWLLGGEPEQVVVGFALSVSERCQ